MVGLVEAFIAFWKNYFNFNDRTSRAGFWWVYLVVFIINIIFTVILTNGLLNMMASSELFDFSNYSYGYNDYNYSNYYDSFFTSYMTMINEWTKAMIVPIVIHSIWGCGTFIPSLSILIRRLHDIGKRWYWIFIFIIPFAGFIIWIIFMVTPSKLPHENELGYLRQV